MSRPVAMHLITGFLGAGKTTLVHRVLAEQPADEKLAVLVNEFGQLGIDGKLLEGFGSQVRELASGCICCELKIDFIAALGQIIEEFNPRRILVEATGLAEAGDLLGAAQSAAAGGKLEVASVICVVDAEMFGDREMFGSSYFSQIKAADLLLLNKTDLLEPGEIEPLLGALAELNPEARLMPVVRCAVDRQTIVAPRGGGRLEQGQPLAGFTQGLTTLADLGQGPDHRPGQDDGFLAFAFEHPGRLDRQRLEDFLGLLPWGVLRIKGAVRLDGATWLLNYTHRRPEFTPLDNGGPTGLALITWQLPAEPLLDGLRACVVD